MSNGVPDSGESDERRVDVDRESALSGADRYFRDFFDYAPLGCCLTSPEGKLLCVNRAFGSMLGFTTEELRRIPFATITHPDDLGLSREALRSLLAGERDTSVMEKRYLAKDGRLVWTEVTIRLLRGEDGAPLYFLTQIQEITESKRQQDALRQSEELYRSLFENMLNGLAYCRMLFEDGRPKDFIYVDVNTAFESQTGLKDVIGKKVSDVIPGIRESDPDIFETYGRVVLTGKPEFFETYVDGLQNWFAISVYRPSKDHFVAVFNVVTERKRAEEALRQSEQGFRQLVEALKESEDRYRTIGDTLRYTLEQSPAVLYTLKQEDGGAYAPVHVSDNVERLLGVSAAEAARPEWWLDGLHPEDRDRVVATVSRGLKGDGYSTEYRLRHRNGTYIWIEDNNRVLRDASGTPRTAAGAWTDITARKNLEAEVDLREHLLRGFFTRSTAGLVLLDHEMRYVRISDSLAAMNGLPAQEHIGRTVRDVIPGMAPQIEPVLRTVLATGKPFMNVEVSGETREHPGVERRWLESFFPIADAGGAPAGVGGVVVEITDRRRAEAAAEEAVARLRLALGASNIGPWDWNVRTKEVYFSPEWKRQIGHEDHEIANTYEEWESRLHPDDVAPTLAAVTAYVEGRTTEYAVEFRLRHKNGSYRWIYTRAELVNGSDGKPLRLIGCHLDITQRRTLPLDNVESPSRTGVRRAA